jgi:hypothetical protein
MLRLPVNVTVPLDHKLFEAEIATPAPPGAAADRLKVSPAELEAVVPVRLVNARLGLPCEWFDRAAVVR